MGMTPSFLYQIQKSRIQLQGPRLVTRLVTNVEVENLMTHFVYITDIKIPYSKLTKGRIHSNLTKKNHMLFLTAGIILYNL